MQNDVGKAQRAHSPNGEQIRIARSSPDQIYLSLSLCAWILEQEPSSVEVARIRHPTRSSA